MSETMEIEVECPDCGDLNRAARRDCKRNGGMCHGTGKVRKNVPVQVESETPLVALAAMEIGTQKRFGNRAIERRDVDSFDIADEADPQLPFLKDLSKSEAAAYIAKGPTT